MSSGDRREPQRLADPVRAFICIEVPESIKKRIEVLQQYLRQSGAQVSWTRPSNIHLTIKFLGDVEAGQLQRVSERVGRAAGAIGKFEIEVSGAGCFPSAKNPRVLWVGLARIPSELKDLHRAIEDELASEGFARDKKRFSPHLTIGRIRSPRGAATVAEKLVAYGFEPEIFKAREIFVMRSELNPSGSVYTPLASIKI